MLKFDNLVFFLFFENFSRKFFREYVATSPPPNKRLPIGEKRIVQVAIRMPWMLAKSSREEVFMWATAWMIHMPVENRYPTFFADLEIRKLLINLCSEMGKNEIFEIFEIS